jgi:uncharacterized membrane protein (DUF106 family)
MAVVLQEKLREFAEDNDKQNLNTPGVKRHEMQEERNEMPGIGMNDLAGESDSVLVLLSL